MNQQPQSTNLQRQRQHESSSFRSLYLQKPSNDIIFAIGITQNNNNNTTKTKVGSSSPIREKKHETTTIAAATFITIIIMTNITATNENIIVSYRIMNVYTFGKADSQSIPAVTANENSDCNSRHHKKGRPSSKCLNLCTQTTLLRNTTTRQQQQKQLHNSDSSVNIPYSLQLLLYSSPIKFIRPPTPFTKQQNNPEILTYSQYNPEKAKTTKMITFIYSLSEHTYTAHSYTHTIILEKEHNLLKASILGSYNKKFRHGVQSGRVRNR